MGVVLRLIALVVGRLKALSFFEWIGISAIAGQIADSAFVKGIERFMSDEIFAASGVRVDPNALWTAAGWSEGLSTRLGIPLRDITDAEKVKEDVLAAGVSAVVAKVGITLTDITSVDAVRNDLMAFGASSLAIETGIYLSNPLDVEAVKADLMTWGKQEAMKVVSDDIAASASLQDGDGLRLIQLLEARGFPGMKPKEIMAHAQSVLIGYVAEEYERARPFEKLARKRLLQRAASDKFRRAHGNRSRYVPLGWTAQITPPPDPVP